MRDHDLLPFVSSYSLNTHPLARARKKTKIRYYAILEYLAKRFTPNTGYATARLAQFRTKLVGNETAFVLTDVNRSRSIRSVVNDWLSPWKRNHYVWLMCDLALMLVDRSAIEKVQAAMATYLSKSRRALLSELVTTLLTDKPIRKDLLFADSWIQQFRRNRKFTAQPELRVMITANMSAGKSTLINALIGKAVARTSLEVCTANLSYLFNKPVEDDAIHLFDSPLNLNATYDELMNVGQAASGYIASYFRSFAPSELPQRICLIDTPGVNSAINREHGNRTRKALLEEQYDKLIYVLNANRLGTDEELSYLKYVSEHVPKHKIIFVLNKVDDFKSADDSIAASVEGVRNDLLQLGYDNPVVCPLSAYFALLLKFKQNGEPLNEDEQDAYDFFVKKFSRDAFDLSVYSNETAAPVHSNKDNRSELAARSGLYGLETLLYGGIGA